MTLGRWHRGLAAVIPLFFFYPAASAQPVSSASSEAFFENRIRPLFTERCQECHNDRLKTSGLSVESRESILAGGTRGAAIVPGRPEQSLLVEAIHYEANPKMPPSGRLSGRQIEDLVQWISDGAKWGRPSVRPLETRAKHWSFQPVNRPEPPEVERAEWVRNPIDRFVLARLEAQGIRPSDEADKRTLLRRLSLDLTGLPPTPAEIRDFLEDESEESYQRVVDRLLASPHYGERWGRHWLDIAHYADSHGYSIDGERPIWKYRDWVIAALNKDLPFDRFVIEQVAGDLLPERSDDSLTATGFYRNTMINQEGGVDFEQYRVEAVVDRVNTTGEAFLGLTIGCARCHDHKFDPISQKDFFQLYAFFNSIDEVGGEFSDAEARKRLLEPVLEFGGPEEFAVRDALRKQVGLLEKELAEYGDQLDPSGLEPTVAEIAALPREKRTKLQQDVLSGVWRKLDPGYQARDRSIRALRKLEPQLEATLVLEERLVPRSTYIHRMGDFLRPGELVQPGAPAVLPPLRTSRYPTRLDLASWLVSPENPLTARVTVNRLWQRYFGLGIVETENDFGTQGTPPSHPALLDWLASELVARDWSLKAMHRLIVDSATYRQSSAARPELKELDPRNRLLARQNRLRLEAEIIRDVALAASGLLTPTIGGASVFPPQAEGAGRVTQVDRKWEAETGPNRYRRGMYTHFWRSAPHPGLVLFDAPNAQEAVTRRNRSNTPLQALTLLNDQAHTEFARALAARIPAAPGETPERELRHAFELCLGRLPTPREEERLLLFLEQMVDEFDSDPGAALEVVGATNRDRSGLSRQAAWTALSRVLLNLDEFVTRR